MSWKTYKLSELCNVFADGDWIESKDQSPEGIRLLQTGNIGVGVFKEREDKARYVSEETFKRLNCEEVFEGDLLISRLPEPVGRGCLIPSITSRAITAVDCTIIRVKSDLVDKRYLEYFIQSQRYQTEIQSKVTGTTRQRISRKNLGEISIVLTSLPVQKQIVEKLDAAFSDIDKGISVTEKNLENAEALFQSLLNNQFNSKENLLSLKEVAELDKKQGKYMDLPYIGMEDIESGTGKFLGDLSNKEMKSNTFKFNSDHLLYGRLRPYLNKVMLPDFEGHCSTEIFPILVKESIKKEYLFYWLISEETVKQINRTSTGARMPRANYKAIEEFKLNVPDINSQMEIVKKIKAIELKLRNYKHLNTKKISEFNLLKSSILNQAFSGELTKDAA